MQPNEFKLDNPVFYALSEKHQKFAIDFDHIKFYHPDYCPFGGFVSDNDISTPISEYAKNINTFYIIGPKPDFTGYVKLKSELVCLQMIIYQKIAFKIEDEIIELDESHLKELLALVKLVYPEYFKPKTVDLGKYYGIFKTNQLIAVTGERMKMNEFTEVSAVITHPHYTGKGYAKQLLAHTVNTILDQKKIPFLHVSKANTGAIALYERLGFYTRKELSVWNLVV